MNEQTWVVKVLYKKYWRQSGYLLSKVVNNSPHCYFHAFYLGTAHKKNASREHISLIFAVGGKPNVSCEAISRIQMNGVQVPN